MSSIPAPGHQNDSLSLAFVGDVCLGLKMSDILREHGAESLFRTVSPILKQADLRIGNFDFSVIVAIIVLSILASITGRLAAAAVVTFGYVLALIIVRVASAASFFLVFFLIMALIRLIGGAIGVNTSGRIWITLDRLLEPVVHKIILSLSRGRFVSYRNALLLFCALIVLTLFVGGFLVDGLVNLAGRIPF